MGYYIPDDSFLESMINIGYEGGAWMYVDAQNKKPTLLEQNRRFAPEKLPRWRALLRLFLRTSIFSNRKTHECQLFVVAVKRR
jgi:hypothetical protein